MIKRIFIALMFFAVANSYGMSLLQLRKKSSQLAQRTAIKAPRLLQRLIVPKAASSTLAIKPTQSPRLDPFMYRLKAREILSKTLALGQGLPNDYQKYLSEQSSLEKRMKDNQLDVNKAIQQLDPSYVSLFTLNHVDSDSGARFLSEFARTNRELLAHRVRRTLGCYTNSLDLGEWSYAMTLTKVSEEEYVKRLDTLKSSDIDTIIIEEASAQANSLLQDAKAAEVFVSSAAKGNIDANPYGMKFYLDKKRDINVIDCLGHSALMIAAEKGQLKAVELLIDRGANPFIICTNEFNEGMRAKDFAFWHGQKQIVELLEAYEERWIQDKLKAASSSTESAAVSQTAAANK